jgi:hypothetical protein
VRNSDLQAHSELPKFFVVGPPRTGTTWLHRELAGSCSLPRPKETSFFNHEFKRGLKWYEAHFARMNGLPRGEICPTYFYCDAARERMAQLAPQAKIVCCFRKPVARLYSLYKLKRAEAYHDYSFAQSVAFDSEMLDSARYGTHFARWQASFGAQNVLATFMEDLQNDPLQYLRIVCEFVGIAPPEKVNTSPAYGTETMALPRNYRVAHWLNAHRGSLALRLARRAGAKRLLPGGGGFEAVEPGFAAALREILRPEVEKLERLTGRDLSAWKCAVADAPAVVSDAAEPAVMPAPSALPISATLPAVPVLEQESLGLSAPQAEC